MNIIIKPSKNPLKKYDAIIDGKKTLPFGDKNYQDFTTHKDKERKQRYLERHKNEERKHRYIDRHKKNENWNDPTTAGFYSRWITWNKPTLNESIKDTNRRFKNVNIKFSAFK